VCILLLAQCCGDAVVDHTLPFVSQHFNSTDWHYREAAIMAFGSVLEGPSAQKLSSLADQAILPLVGAMSDANLEVRDTAAWAIGRVCDSCPESVVKEGTLKSLLQALLSALQDHPRVASNACWVGFSVLGALAVHLIVIVLFQSISSLAKAAYQVGVSKKGTNVNGQLETSDLSPYSQIIADALAKVTER